MHRLCASAVIACTLSSFTVHADTETGLTGDGLAYDNRQPSLALNYVVPPSGIFPSRDDAFGAGGQTLGNVRLFATQFSPGNSPFAQGQLLSLSQNTALFSLLGTSYGGNGSTTFALPDLRSRAAVHTGTGPWQIGETRGVDAVTLSAAQLPAHQHSDPSPTGVTGSTGNGVAVDNVQPSLGLNYVVATSGVFPSPNAGGPGPTFLGQVALFAGNFAPSGWAFADGQLLNIDDYDALFFVIGTTYGGDGQTSFALPDLRGRVPVGAGNGPGLTPWTQGEVRGADATILTVAQLPAHDHSLPAPGTVTGMTGGGGPIDNVQAAIGMTYLIATQGLYPPQTGGLSEETYLGELTLFAGHFAPRGWALADGRLLPINQNQALFSLLGTNYGGDGVTTFALPDLRGRVVIGANTTLSDLGAQSGQEFVTLSTAQLAPHLHSTTVPIPGAAWLLAIVVAGVLRRRVADAA